MPFDTGTFKALLAWADKIFEKLPKCDRCGDLLPEHYYTVQELYGDKFCSEYCAERAYADAFREEEVPA
ncbi:MAG: hypothetical protein Q7T04_02340 [Dehalococcoidia bacterium]|nr:hypothetical protein [Dehalococcoidia bacterium]